MLIKMKDGDLINTDHIVQVAQNYNAGAYATIIWSTGTATGINKAEYDELLENLYP